VDVIGSDSLLNEIELIQIMDEVFTKLSVRAKIKMNNRKILYGISEYMGEPGRMTDITVAIDKLDKIGEENVFAELRDKGISLEAVEKIRPLLTLSGTPREKLVLMAKILEHTSVGMKGIEETQKIMHCLEGLSLINMMKLILLWPGDLIITPVQSLK